ncbi:general substrate transporter [Limtongia smithiae]|uniref:general substrate transporter n=1 Tax=Limtongia smithiae TaxID=1125753 RepID=UPI0034CFE5C0
MAQERIALLDDVDDIRPVTAPAPVYHPGDLSRFHGCVLQDFVPLLQRPWYTYPRLFELNALLLSAMLTQITCGFDGSMLNSLQSVPAWRAFFDEPSGARLALMGNAMIFGVIAFTPVFPYLCERYGRRLPIFGGCAFVALGSLAQGLAGSYRTFVVARFFIGVGLSLSSTASPLLIVECAYPSQRGTMTSLIEPAWPLGSFFAAITTALTAVALSSSNWSWRIPSLMQGLFPLVQCLLVLYAPESPRWLVSKDRYDEAYAILRRYHGSVYDADLIDDATTGTAAAAEDLVQFEMAEICAALAAEQTANLSRWRQFFETGGMRHRFFIVVVLSVMLQFSGMSILSYYLPLVLASMGVTSPNTQLMINLGATIVSIGTSVISGLTVERVGRRPGFLFGFITMLLTMEFWTFLTALAERFPVKFTHSGFLLTLNIAVMYLFQAFYHIVAPLAPTYMVEVVPYSLRSKTTMLTQLVQNLTIMLNNFINPIALAALRWRYYALYCGVLATWTVVAYQWFPETGGKGLEEIAQIFDDIDVDDLTVPHSGQLFKDFDNDEL